MKNHNLFLLGFYLFFTFSSFAQVTCEQTLQKKDDILIKVNKSTSIFIEGLQIENKQRLQQLESLKSSMILRGLDVEQFDFWKEKADSVVEKTSSVINIILEEMNTIAKLADDSLSDYVTRSGYTKRAKGLHPIRNINNLDNRTIPTKRLLGNNINNPTPEKVHIENELKAFKNEVLSILSNYSHAENTYFFEPIKTENEFEQGLNNVNPDDEYHLKKINELLPLNSVTYLMDKKTNQSTTISWLVDNFAYSSVLETAVIINQIVLKIKLIEKEALDFLSRKIEGPRFYYNKIVTHIVPGENSSKEKLSLKFIIAAIDSTTNYEYRYTLDKDSPKKSWKHGKGELLINKEELINHDFIYGETKVKERGREAWIPWKYSLNEK